MDWRKDDRETWRRKQQWAFYLRSAVSSAAGCLVILALTLSRLLEGRPGPSKVWGLAPALFILFAGLAALNFYRWKHHQD